MTLDPVPVNLFSAKILNTIVLKKLKCQFKSGWKCLKMTLVTSKMTNFNFILKCEKVLFFQWKKSFCLLIDNKQIQNDSNFDGISINPFIALKNAEQLSIK